MVTAVRSQIHMDEQMVNDAELLALLERRHDLKSGADDYRKADKKAKSKIKTITTPMPFRVGRFVISQKTIAGRSVETKDSTSIKIKAVA